MGECLALEGGPPCFGPGLTCPDLLGACARGGIGFAYGALTRCGRPFHAVPLPTPFVTAPEAADLRVRSPTTPGRQRLPLTRARVWAGALSLAATRAVSVDFLSSGYLDVSVPPVASSRPMRSGAGSGAWPPLGSPIRAPPDRRPFAPPRGLSQLAAPFIGFPCQGIRRAPLSSSPAGGPRPPPDGRSLISEQCDAWRNKKCYWCP